MPEARDPFEERLLSAALAVVEAHGLAGLTLGRVAAALGGSRTTLHRRGITREAVVQRVAALAAAEYQRALWPTLTAPGTGAERLERALSATCHVADEHARLLTGLFADDGGLFHDVESAPPEERDQAVATRAVFVEPIARLLRDGLADGSLQVADADETATVLFNQVGWTFLALRQGQRWPAERARQAVVGLAVAGVRSPAPP